MAAPICRMFLRSSPILSRFVALSVSTNSIHVTGNVNPVIYTARISQVKGLHTTKSRCCNNETEDANENETEAGDGKKRGKPRPVIDLETSMKYLKSKAYKITYGESLVWEPYRRNFKGHFLPKQTRTTCIRGGVISTGNPCPICRDEYLVIHPKNLGLLTQFVSPQTGMLISSNKTGVCQKQHENLLIALTQAWDEGLLEKPIPYRQYHYEDYYPNDLLDKRNSSSVNS